MSSRYYDALRAAGASHEEAAEAAAEQQRIKECLDRCECPSCGGPMDKKRDQRQVGMSKVRGDWVNYRCPKEGCKMAIDRKEEFV